MTTSKVNVELVGYAPLGWYVEWTDQKSSLLPVLK